MNNPEYLFRKVSVKTSFVWKYPYNALKSIIPIPLISAETHFSSGYK